MAHRVCPWWLGYWLACPWFRRGQNPKSILAPYVHEGMIVVEPGPGMGFFTLELARLVGISGRVVAVDIQPRMLDRLKGRAVKAGLADRIEVRRASAESMGIKDLEGSVDFILAFSTVHEFPDSGRFFREATAVLKPSAKLLLAEPNGHVKTVEFDSEIQAAVSAGFELIDRPSISRSQAALLKKT